MTVSGEIVVTEDPPEAPMDPPKYAAVLLCVRSQGGAVAHVGAAAQVDGVFVFHDSVKNTVRTTALGRSVGYAVVDPANYAHLDLAQVLHAANSGTGTTPWGVRVTLITVPTPQVHPNIYQLEYAREREIAL